MSEAAESVAENVVEAPTPEPLTPEQKVFHVKNNLRNTLNGFHNNLFNFVNGLPINEDQKKFALANLIQGLHWVEDGLEALQFEVTELPPVPPAEGCEQPPAESDVNQPEGAPQC